MVEHDFVGSLPFKIGLGSSTLDFLIQEIQHLNMIRALQLIFKIGLGSPTMYFLICGWMGCCLELDILSCPSVGWPLHIFIASIWGLLTIQDICFLCLSLAR